MPSGRTQTNSPIRTVTLGWTPEAARTGCPGTESVHSFVVLYSLRYRHVALEHGVSKESIENAVMFRLYRDVDFEPGSEPRKLLYLGHDTNGNLIEVMANEIEGTDELVVFHAMTMRKLFQPLVDRAMKGNV